MCTHICLYLYLLGISRNERRDPLLSFVVYPLGYCYCCHPIRNWADRVDYAWAVVWWLKSANSGRIISGSSQNRPRKLWLARACVRFNLFVCVHSVTELARSRADYSQRILSFVYVISISGVARCQRSEMLSISNFRALTSAPLQLLQSTQPHVVDQWMLINGKRHVFAIENIVYLIVLVTIIVTSARFLPTNEFFSRMIQNIENQRVRQSVKSMRWPKSIVCNCPMLYWRACMRLRAPFPEGNRQAKSGVEKAGVVNYSPAAVRNPVVVLFARPFMLVYIMWVRRIWQPTPGSTDITNAGFWRPHRGSKESKMILPSLHSIKRSAVYTHANENIGIW